MKLKIALLAASVALCGLSATAQTNNPSTTAENNFFATATEWAGSIDYTKSWPTNGIRISVGALWQNNVNWANYIAAQKNFGDIGLTSQMANQGVAGTIERVQAGPAYRFLNRGDLEMQVEIQPGYARKTVDNGAVGRGLFIEPQVTMRKLMAHGAFLEMSLNYDVFTTGQQPNYPGLRIGTGFTF